MNQKKPKHNQVVPTTVDRPSQVEKEKEEEIEEGNAFL